MFNRKLEMTICSPSFAEIDLKSETDVDAARKTAAHALYVREVAQLQVIAGELRK